MPNGSTHSGARSHSRERVLLLLPLFSISLLDARPVHLRCEHLENPLGIDAAAPRLSWQSDSTDRNWRQSAYQILVATSAALLAEGKADVWDSGKQAKDDSNQVVYGGPKLESRRRYFWTVRVWDGAGQSAGPDAPAWWEMGLLQPADWSAQWIYGKNPEEEADRAAGARWIWIPGQDPFAVPKNSTTRFRVPVSFRDKPKSAVLWVIAHGEYHVLINGQPVALRKNWREFEPVEIGESMTVPGADKYVQISVTAEKTGALAALLKITHADGTIERIPSGDRWEVLLPDGNWKPAAAFADLSDKRLGDPWPAQPASLLRHAFSAAGAVKSARLYVTALGSYRVFLNGTRVGRDILTPDWTDYRKRVLYQTYDVTSLMARGQNVIGAILGDGWYGSGLGWTGQRFNFGPRPPRLLAQLEITFGDGKRVTIASGETWKTSSSPILRSEIYAGETYDARLEQPGWNKSGFKDTNWNRAETAAAPPQAAISSQMSPAIQVTETLKPKAIQDNKDGTFVFDMGQNMVGWVVLKLSGPAGTTIRLRFAEIQQPDGHVYRENLRNAAAEDTFILRGGGEETFEPHFTYHGFRYVEITGFPGTPTLDTLTGQVFHTANEFTGKFTSSNPIVNKIWQNTLWGQRGNLESVPTDCPQRDERLGWMGDAQIFWRTASYNMDMAAFTHKWMRDVVEAQSPEGGFSDVSPRVIDERDGAPGWGDAGVIVPWTAWKQYGDTRIIQENWDAMERWMKYIAEVNPDLIRAKRRNNDFGDWVPADSTTPKDLIATAYWAYDADLMSQMAHVSGKAADAKRYAELFSAIRAAFQKKFIHDDAEVGNGSQTCYALALYMHLAPEELRPKLLRRLADDIQMRSWHLSTGFIGTPYLLSSLAEGGRTDLAYWLLGDTTYPSWGYMINHGATTMWERWNGDTGDPSMNSFNHYAFGSVVEWMYRYAAGIDTAPDSAGFKKIVIRPRTDGRMSHVRAEYDSVYGNIISDWTLERYQPFKLHVTIPPNTTATVYLPAELDKPRVTESGKPIEYRKGPEGTVLCEIGSGSYDFQVGGN